jgi:hypothetical protein
MARKKHCTSIFLMDLSSSRFLKSNVSQTSVAANRVKNREYSVNLNASYIYPLNFLVQLAVRVPRGYRPDRQKFSIFDIERYRYVFSHPGYIFGRIQTHSRHHPLPLISLSSAGPCHVLTIAAFHFG